MRPSLAFFRYEETLTQIIENCGDRTCIVVDEAQLGLPGKAPKTEAEGMLQVFVNQTKKERVSVLLCSSDFTYPFQLQACGLDLFDIQKVFIANEVPEAQMKMLMVNLWEMSEELAELFVSYCGGHIDLCRRGVELLQDQREGFSPFSLLERPLLPDCCENPAARGHLRNLAKQGWSPVYNINNDTGAKSIAEANVGGVIPSRAKGFDLPKGMWEGHKYALIPSGTLMRRMIAEELKRSLDAFLGIST